MKAVVFDAFGGVDKLRLADVPDPVPADDEVLIQMAATSVNPVDWKIREGHLAKMLPYRFPIIPGWDAAGTVSTLGKAVRAFKPGDRVYAYARKPEVHGGTYAELLTLPESFVAPMPARLSFEEAAAIPLVGLTAWQCREFLDVKSGQTVLVHAGAGGVGSMAIQFCKVAGARVITTASAKNHEYVRGLGADVALDYAKDNVTEAVRKHAPHSVDAVFDLVGPEAQKQSLPVMAKGGKLVSIVSPPDPEEAKKYGVTVGYVFVSPNGQQLREIARLIDDGKVKPPATTVLPLAEAAKAQQLSQSGHTRGKLVLKIRPSS